jgi:hypothetical protein
VTNSVKPRGNADTADEYLTAAGEGTHLRHVSDKNDADPARHVAALQGIGFALLAVCDQLADVADATTDNGGQLAEIACSVDDLTIRRRARAREGLTAVFARLAHIRKASPQRPGTVELTAPQAVIVRHALADAVAWRNWHGEGFECTACITGSGKCAGHSGDEDLADAYEALRARLAGSDTP